MTLPVTGDDTGLRIRPFYTFDPDSIFASFDFSLIQICDGDDEMLRNTKSRILISFCVVVILVLACTILCNSRGQQPEDRTEKVISDMKYHNVAIKYVSGNDKLYYQIAASEEFIKQFNLQNWVLTDAENTLTTDKYLVVRIAEKYEIVLFSNQLAKIYDYYGSYGTDEPESLFYKTSSKIQTIVDFLEQSTGSNPYYDVGFEN